MYAFILPLSRAGIVAFSALLIILWIVEGGFKEKFSKIVNERFTLSLILFLLFCIFSLFWVEPDNIDLALNYLKKYWYLLVIFPIFTSLKQEYILKLLYAFLLGMTVSMILSWSIYFQWGQIREVTVGSLSPFMYHVFYSIFLAFAALLSLNFAFNSKHKFLVLLLILLSILFISILFMGVGRTGQVIFIIGLFILVLQNFTHKIRAVIITLMASVVIFGTLYQFNETFKERTDFVKNDIVQMVEEDEYCNSLGGRIITWKISYEALKEHPIIGIGIADHLEYLKNKMNSDEKFSTCHIKHMIGYFHGQYIEIASQIGILGLLFFLTIFYFLLQVKIENKMINSIKIILIMTFLLVFFVDVPFRKQFALALFALMSAIIIRQKNYEDGKE